VDYTTPELYEAQIFEEYFENVEEIANGIDQENRTHRRDEDTKGRRSSDRHGTGSDNLRY